MPPSGPLFAALSGSPIGAFLAKQLGQTSGALKGGFTPTALIQLVKANPFLSAAIFGSHFWQHGATIPIIDQHIPGPMDLKAMGQITGQGYGEGLHSYLHSVRMGINPFDTISTKMAQEIETAVHEQGFHGHQASVTADASANLVKSLGIDYQKAVELVTNNVKNGSQSLKEFVKSIKELRDVAKETNQSVKTVTESFQSFVDNAQNIGGPKATVAAGDFAKSIQLALPGVSQLGGKQLLDFIKQHGAELTAFGGGNPLLANTPEGLKYVPLGLQRYLSNFLAGKPSGMPIETYVAMEVNSGATKELFGDLSAAQILRLLGVAKSGKLVHRITAAQKKVVRTSVHEELKHPGKTHEEKKIDTEFKKDYLTGGRFGALALREGRLHDARIEIHKEQIKQLDKVMIEHGVKPGTARAVDEFLTRHDGSDYSKAQKVVMEHLPVLLTLNAAETRRFLSGKEVQKSLNLHGKRHGGPDTKTTRGAR